MFTSWWIWTYTNTHDPITTIKIIDIATPLSFLCSFLLMCILWTLNMRSILLTNFIWSVHYYTVTYRNHIVQKISRTYSFLPLIIYSFIYYTDIGNRAQLVIGWPYAQIPTARADIRMSKNNSQSQVLSWGSAHKAAEDSILKCRRFQIKVTTDNRVKKCLLDKETICTELNLENQVDTGFSEKMEKQGQAEESQVC